MDKENFLLLVKDEYATKFAQALDVFENFKFVGRTVEAAGIFQEPIPKVLRNFVERVNTTNFKVVGVIVPGRGAAILADHKAMSDGNKWCLVEDICASHNAPLEIVNA